MLWAIWIVWCLFIFSDCEDGTIKLGTENSYIDTQIKCGEKKK